MDLPKVKGYHRVRTIYVVYNQEGQIAARGTAEECAQRLGWKRGTFHRHKSLAKSGKYHKYSFCEEESET